MIPFNKIQIGEDERDMLKGVFNQMLDKTNFILGEEVFAFEKDFAQYIGTSYCVSVNSGTDAIYLALRILDIGPGDEVIIQANVMPAQLISILNCGAVPVFVDIESTGYQMDTKQLQAAITPQTKAVIATHMYGEITNAKNIANVCIQNDVKYIEDVSHAVGASLDNIKAGAIGDIGCFSFYPTKNLGALGDAGGLVFNNSDWNEKARSFRNYGTNKDDVCIAVGMNSRMDALQASVLRHRLYYLDSDNAQRRLMAMEYDTILKTNKIIKPKIRQDNSHVYHLYVISTDKRNELIKALDEESIRTKIHYPMPLHYHPIGKPFATTSLPNTEKACKAVLSLPFWFGIKGRIKIISKIINKFTAATGEE